MCGIVGYVGSRVATPLLLEGLKRLEYRALHPVFHTERFTVNGNPGADGASVDLWTANAAGNYAMTGTAVF